MSNKPPKKSITLSEKNIKNIIKESVREIFEQESIKFRALFLPSVSQKEQKNIEKLYGKPSRDVAKSLKIKI